MNPSTINDKILVPHSFNFCKIQVIEELVSEMLEKLCQHNDKIPVNSSQLTRFHSRAPPNITISAYIKRIIQYTSLEKSILILLLLYIDRICQRVNFNLSSLTVHRFIIACVTVTAKTLCDSYCTNTHYARVGGISTAELNTLELEFLFLSDWNLIVESKRLQEYYEHLVDSSNSYQRITEQQQNDQEFVNLFLKDTFDESLKISLMQMQIEIESIYKIQSIYFR